MNFFTLKGIFEALLKRFDIQSVAYERIELNNYHPHQTALIRLADRVIGHIGKIHPETAKAFDLEAVYVLEVDLKALFEAHLKKSSYQGVQRYPSVSRDIAIVLDKQCEAGKVIEKIKETCGSVLSTVTIFDVYEGDPLPQSKKSLGIRMVFVNPKKTLKASKVDALVDQVIDDLQAAFDASLRK